MTKNKNTSPKIGLLQMSGVQSVDNLLTKVNELLIQGEDKKFLKK
jgi:hypothetical protein